MLRHKSRDYTIALASCYLPPENSKHGIEPDTYFECLTQLAYISNECDTTLIGGDLYACIGEEPDYIDGVDEITLRTPIDFVKNKHGYSL